MLITHGQVPHKDRKRAMPQNQLNIANHMVSVFSGNIQCEFSMVACSEILFYISYSLCIAFRLCSSMIVFYTSVKVKKLVFLENKIIYVSCIFADFIFTFETKNSVMCISQTQSVTLFPCNFIILVNQKVGILITKSIYT